MMGWAETTIEELALNEANSVVDGPFGSNLKVSDYVENGIPVLQGNNITKDKFRFDNIRFITKEKSTTLYRSNAKVGDLITVKIGSVGYSAIIDSLDEYPYAIIPANLLRSRFNPNKINTEYIYYFLTSQRGKRSLTDLASNTAQPALSLGSFKGLKVPHPKSIAEQTSIAEILSTADAAIAQTEALIAKYQRIKTGLMQDLLTRGIDANGNIRSKATQRFDVKNGIEVPEEWEVVAFKELCALIKDGTHLPPKRVEDGIWLLGVSNIIAGEWKLTSSDTQVSEEFYNEMHRNWEIEVGDVLLAIVGATIGKVTQVPKDFPKFTLQRSVCVLRGITNELSNDFLRLYIESPFFYRALWNEVNVTAQPGIYLDTIGKFFIPKPSYEEQLRIVKNAATMKTVIDNFKDNLSKLHSLKTGLMQDLLSGRVRVKVHNE